MAKSLKRINEIRGFDRASMGDSSMMDKIAKACEKRPFVVIGAICALQNSPSNIIGDFR